MAEDSHMLVKYLWDQDCSFFLLDCLLVSHVLFARDLFLLVFANLVCCKSQILLIIGDAQISDVIMMDCSAKSCICEYI